MPADHQASSAEAEVEGFIAKFTPELQVCLRDARAKLRSLFPRGYELVFDNYNALVFGIGATDRTTSSFISIAAYPRWITLFFLHGKDLDDPTGILDGEGKQIRSVRLVDRSTFADPAVRALVAQAIAPQAAALREAPPLATVIRMRAAKQRPRRPA